MILSQRIQTKTETSFHGVGTCWITKEAGRTLTAQYYRDFLVRLGAWYKRPDLVDIAIILNDNARPHKEECAWQLPQRWEWEKLEHPPCSPDISPCDFDLILKIKEPIRGRRFATREDIANAVRQQVT
ncbi:uncharacterized protein TNCV_1135601 [Trichonephila clavipes]|nr:uncharacterized protein TNCV_1135601 [Trichonephila clavipes]